MPALPSQRLTGPRGIRNQDRRVAGSSSFDCVGDRPAGLGLGHLDDFEYGVALLGTQVECVAAGIARQVLQRPTVGIRQVGDVHEVADAGAVPGGIVVAENLQPAQDRGPPRSPPPDRRRRR